MEHRKDIGKAIREKLSQLDKSPDDHVWASIEADLPRKKKRRMLPFWLLIALVSVSLIYFKAATSDGRIDQQSRQIIGHNDTQNENAANPDKSDGLKTEKTDANAGLANGKNVSKDVTVDKNANHAPALSPENDRKNLNVQKAHEVAVSGAGKHALRPNHKKNGNNKSFKNGKSQTWIAGSPRKKKHARKPVLTDENSIAAGFALSTATDGKNKNESTTETSDKLIDKPSDREIAIAKKDSAKVQNAKNSVIKKAKDTMQTAQVETAGYKTFSVFLYAAPSYYGRISKISSLDRRLDSIPGNGATTFNYGGYLCFEYDQKWSFRIGVSKTKLQYNSGGIAVSSLNAQNYYNVDYSGDLSNQAMAEAFADSQRFNIVEEVSYLEFPIELKYKLVDRNRLSVEAIGGASTLFLRQNSLTAESDYSGSIVFGSNKDISKAYFSFNAGVGFGYKIADNFRLNFEPVFKYHLKSGSVALHSYSIAALTGIEYTFNWRKTKNPKPK